MSLLILGIDPGLAHTGWCVTGLRDIFTPHSQGTIERDSMDQMEAAIIQMVLDLKDTVQLVGIEDFGYHPKLTQQVVTSVAQMGRLLGRLDVGLRAMAVDPMFIGPRFTKRGFPKGQTDLKRLGVPGRNSHERSAWMVCNYIAGTARLRGAG